MGKRKAKGRQKETRNANRTDGTPTCPDGRVDAYLTIDTPAGPYRMRTTKATQEKADAWLLEVRYPGGKRVGGREYSLRLRGIGVFGAGLR